MARPFKELLEAMPAASRRRVEARTRKMLAEMRLRELRRARRLTQDLVARALHANQAHVSKLERRADPRLSSLRRYVAALGGELEIVARFPEGEVRIRPEG